jgi:hypothetical protein
MTTTDEQQLARLPRWARSEISQLRHRVADLEARLGNGVPPAWIEVDPFGDRIGIPKGETVRFHADGEGAGERGHRSGVDVRLRSGASMFDVDGYAIEVMGEGPLVVRPQSGNLVYIEAWRR